MKPNFSQNIIAVVWDFDKTLIPHYMQKPIFEEFAVDESQFWAEVNQLPGLYEKQKITLSSDTAYLNHILTYTRLGIFKNLSNSKLQSLGTKLDFFPGVLDFFTKSQNLICTNEDYQRFDLKLEHYIVSTGLTAMIRGSQINPLVKGIWGCEFIETQYLPDNGKLKLEINPNPEIVSIAYQIDNTTKTRALFEINKGVNIHPEDISVNQSMSEEDRRVPFQNMIYVADGPSDIPAFSVVKKNGGKALAVYARDNEKSFKQANQLLLDNRVDFFGEADYRESTTTNLWLSQEIKVIAERIMANKKSKLRQAKDSIPVHLN
jgi:hypothetical protein